MLFEFVNCGDLKNFIKCRGGAILEEHAHFLLIQIIKAIRDHTDVGIMHRDLKLSNIGLNFKNLSIE